MSPRQEREGGGGSGRNTWQNPTGLFAQLPRATTISPAVWQLMSQGLPAHGCPHVTSARLHSRKGRQGSVGRIVGGRGDAVAGPAGQDGGQLRAEANGCIVLTVASGDHYYRTQVSFACREERAGRSGLAKPFMTSGPRS